MVGGRCVRTAEAGAEGRHATDGRGDAGVGVPAGRRGPARRDPLASATSALGDRPPRDRPGHEGDGEGDAQRARPGPLVAGDDRPEGFGRGGRSFDVFQLVHAHTKPRGPENVDSGVASIRRAHTDAPPEGGRTMSRKVADCRDFPSETNCTLTISGTQSAAEHAVSTHGHTDGPELRREILAMLKDEEVAVR